METLDITGTLRQDSNTIANKAMVQTKSTKRKGRPKTSTVSNLRKDLGRLSRTNNASLTVFHTLSTYVKLFRTETNGGNRQRNDTKYRALAFD